ncbi:MAG: ABC transporter transmembrane domain-containing protein, partial [Thermodesulfobacteriota bacterium]
MIKLEYRHRRILAMIRENRGKLAAAMFCMLLVAASTSATAFLVKPVLDDIFFKGDTAMLKIVPLVVLVVYLLRGIGIFGQNYLMDYVGQSIIRRMRNQLYDSIQDLPLSFFQAERTGVLMSRITNDVHIIKEMVSSSVTTGLRDVFTILGLTAVVFYRDWQMALGAIVILPLAFYPVVEFGKRVRRMST